MTALNYESYRAEARRRLPKGIFEYIDRGAEDEVALSYNRERFESIKLVPRVLNDVSGRSTACRVFGREQSMPAVVAPTACAGLTWFNGEIELAKAAAKTGIPFCAATEAISSVEEIADAAGGNVWFQLYVWKDRKLTFDLLDRARSAGVETVLLTSDNAVNPKREYNVRNGFDMPMRYSPPAVWDMMKHPGWLLGVLGKYWAKQGIPAHANYPAAFRSSIITAKPSERVAIDSALSWQDVEELRAYWKGNLVVKGVLHPETAIRAHEAGADGIVVSNHGGRMFDSAIAPADVLSRIADLVGNKMTIMADSGVHRGSDLVKLVSLGAKAILVGRAFLFGTAAGGEQGALGVMKMLQDEIDRTMAYLGCLSVEELGADLLLSNLRATIETLTEAKAANAA